MRNSNLWLNVMIAVVLAADQLTKYLVARLMALGESIKVAGDTLRLTYIHNTGAAFGLLTGETILLIIVTVTALGFMFWYRARLPRSERAARFGLSLIISGAFGNLIDRLLFGKVVDFIDCDIPNINTGQLSFFGQKWSFAIERWPAFNIADSAITVGLCLLIWHLWQLEDDDDDEVAELTHPESAVTETIERTAGVAPDSTPDSQLPTPN